ncbi:carotenoid isomerase [Candidatus Cyanaurora vandensis]|uniref:carotenoid isomerase n=1 Tax=Candidatus Cyanaurora vandensis TaxID=2714958 RepID=UPI00257A02FD|nr:carotenoid isomerase [Candidatus Cyanaurora vandensis]
MSVDVVVIGAGLGGLSAAAHLVSQGYRVLVLEKYLIPGGSGGYFERAGYRFDVGASMIFGLGERGTTNLLTRALASVDEKIPSIPDPVQVHYHLQGLTVRVHRDYEQFSGELGDRFPQERRGIQQFYGECWRVFNYLNSMELLSLEEIGYLTRTFLQNPGACLGLARYLPLNVGGVARKYIRDLELLRFIDMECYCWSVVPAARTPMINAGMVFSDRHYGGINYPVGGVGQIALALERGITRLGSQIRYGAHVKRVLLNGRKQAVGVQLATGETLMAQAVVSNATRWDTFGRLLTADEIPGAERGWQQRYQKSASFLSLHLGVYQSLIPVGTDVHHILLDRWADLEAALGTVFVSIPTLLDPSLAPPDRHIIHAFSPTAMDAWRGLDPAAYAQQKQAWADQIIHRVSQILPGLKEAIVFQEVGTPRTHRRFLGRVDGTYGPIPRGTPLGLVGMPFNRTAVPGLYCVGDSTFPGQGLNAVAFSGIACGHRVAVDLR